MKKLLSIILAILMIVTTIPMVALPAGAALTPTATGGCNGNHSGYTKIQLNGGTTHRITKAGNYYINSSIYESTYSPALEIECSGTVTICLNGYDICHTGYGSRVVYLSPNGGELTVNLCDCKGTGEIYHEKGDTGIDFAPGVITLNMYGGTIRDCNSGLSTWSNSTVNMYGGTIKNCSYYGIYQDSNNGKVNIYGGSIINNNEGIRVCSADSVTLTGSPAISGNTNGDLYYRRPNSAVVAKDLSVSSPITIGQDREAAGDYAVVKVDSADMLGSFKYINNTKQLFYNDNQIFVHGDSHSFKDATCTAPKTCTICGATEGVADNTAHATWGEGVLTRPTKTKEGYYTYTCSACGATKTEAAERATNYAEYTKALNDLRAYLDSDKLTDDAKASVAEWLEIYDSDEAYKFIAGEEETVNLYIEAALYYATEIEAAIQDCLAGNHSGNGEYCDICGAALHICDFSGEWKYDSEKHWKECECGEIDEEAEHTLTDGKCDVCEYLFYKILHQPTAEQPYVELNDDIDASYQWYTVDFNKNEVVDDGVIGKTNGSVYKGEIGWSPIWSLDGSADFLVVKLKKGQMLTLVPSAYCGKLGVINGTYLKKADCQAGDEFTYIAETDGLYNVFSENYTSGTSLRAYITDITYTLVDGETSARLQHPVLDEVFACEVTFRDGTREMSDAFVSTHTCDFTGEWKYDSEKHWKECSCGEIDEEAVHTYTDSKCDCGYVCTHETYSDGVCVDCGYECAHEWDDDGYCQKCRTFCKHEDNENGVCTVCDYVLTFSVITGDTVSYYDRFNDALENAEDGSTVKLMKELYKIASYEINKSITFDLNGNNWKTGSSDHIDVNAFVTFTDSVGTGRLNLSLNLYSPCIFNSGTYKGIGIAFETEDTLDDYLAECRGIFDHYTGEFKDVSGEKFVMGAKVDVNHNLGAQTCKGYQCEDCGNYFGEADPDAHDWSNTDGICVICGAECSHEWGEGVLTRPERITSTDWVDGYYTYICNICGDSYDETVKRADYTQLDKILDDYVVIYNDSTILDSVKSDIESIYDDNRAVIFGNRIESEQAEVDEVAKLLADKIDEITAGIADGSAVKADYTAIDEAIAEIEEKLADENVTDEVKAELEEIKSQLEEKKADGNTSAADLAELEKALEDYETELDAGIADGSAVKVDANKIMTEIVNEWVAELQAKDLMDDYEAFNADKKATEEAIAKEKEIIELAYSLEGSVADNAENIAKVEEALREFLADFTKCLEGTHCVKEYAVIEEAKCGENAVEEGTCWFCGEVLTREVEDSALKHSFTKYEVTEEAKCGVEGKEVAYCDNGCGETDEKAIEALEHLFVDYIYNEDATCTADGTKTAECIYSCGETDTVTAEDTMLDHVDEDGDKICDDCEAEIVDICPDCGGKAHADTGVSQYICMIITLIKLVVSLVKALQAVV